MEYQEQLDSIRQYVERNEEGICLIAQAVIDLTSEIKTKKSDCKRGTKTALENMTEQLENFIHVQCSTCSIKDRLYEIEGEQNKDEKQ